ncbi:MAG TPA: helix-turn-helix domain-containing protein [Devosia sp.]
MDTLVSSTEPAAEPAGARADGEVYREECKQAMVPVTEVLAQIGGKWTIHIIMALGKGPLRFSQLLRGIGGISQKMLTATLRDLEKDGFISRKVTPSIPPRVDYELTELGVDLRVPLTEISRWAHANRHRVDEARHRFAEREAEEKRLAW